MSRGRRVFNAVLQGLLALAGRGWRPGTAGPVRRIVVLELTRLGDVCAAASLFTPLRRAHPGATLEAVVQTPYAALLKGEVDAVHGLPGGGWAFLRAAWRLAPSLRDPGLLLVSASPAIRHSVLAWLSRPGRALGFLFPSRPSVRYDSPGLVSARGGGWSRDEAWSGRGHMLERCRVLLRLAGLDGTLPTPFLRAGVQRLQDPLRVVLHAGANWDRRRWPLDRFVDLAGSLAQTGADCVLLSAEAGDPGPLPAGVRRGDGLDLEGLRALLASAALFVGNDSGPMHLAAALGTPCLGLFGPNLAERSGPWPLPGDLASPHRVLWEDVPCRPCDQLRCVQPWDWCMGKLTLERVLAEARAMLAAGNHDPRKDDDAKAKHP